MKKKHKHEWGADPETTKELEGFAEPAPEAPLEKPEVKSDIDTPVQVSDTPARMTGQSLYETYVSVFKEKFNEGHHVPWAQLSVAQQEAWDEIAVNTVNAMLNAV